MKKCELSDCEYEELAKDFFKQLKHFEDKSYAIGKILSCENCRQTYFSPSECEKDERKQVILSLHDSNAFKFKKILKDSENESIYIDKIIALIVFLFGVVYFLEIQSITWISFFCFTFPLIYLTSQYLSGYKEITIRSILEKLENDELIETPNWVKLDLSIAKSHRKEAIGCLSLIIVCLVFSAILNHYVFSKSAIIIWSILYLISIAFLIWQAIYILLFGIENIIKIAIPFTQPQQNLVSLLLTSYGGFLIVFIFFIFHLSSNYQYFENDTIPSFLDSTKYMGKLILDVITFDFSNYFLASLSEFEINQSYVIPKLIEFSFKFTVAIFLLELIYLGFTHNSINEKIEKRLTKFEKEKEEKKRIEAEIKSKKYWGDIEKEINNKNLNISTIKNISKEYENTKQQLFKLENYSLAEQIYFDDSNIFQIIIEYFANPQLFLLSIAYNIPSVYVKSGGQKFVLKKTYKHITSKGVDILKLLKGENGKHFKRLELHETKTIKPYDIRVYLFRKNSISCYQTSEASLMKESTNNNIMREINVAFGLFLGANRKEKNADNNA
ncbi:MAG: hypothetical protein MI974_11225 [Chitinophagales bacterium]|nr:hypothetical protein [Chitinophagales bacterium]